MHSRYLARSLSPPRQAGGRGLESSHRDSRAALREYQQRRWRNAAITTLMARTMGAMGQWEGRMTCTARNTLTRAIPLSLQLRQFDLVLGATRQASRQLPAGDGQADRYPLSKIQ